MRLVYYSKGNIIRDVSIPLSISDLSRILTEKDSDITDNNRNSLRRLLKEPQDSSGAPLFDELKAHQDNNAGIKPCPFCGDRPNYEDSDFCYPSNREGTLWSAHCCAGGCGCGASMLGQTKQEAIDNWNNRPGEFVKRDPYSSFSIVAPHPIAARAMLVSAGLIDFETGELTEHYRQTNE